MPQTLQIDIRRHTDQSSLGWITEHILMSRPGLVLDTIKGFRSAADMSSGDAGKILSTRRDINVMILHVRNLQQFSPRMQMLRPALYDLAGIVGTDIKSLKTAKSLLLLH